MDNLTKGTNVQGWQDWSKTQRGPDGFMPLTFRDSYRVAGGPYRNITKEYQGVKMAEEINSPCRVSVPTRDFSVPNVTDLRAGLFKALELILSGELVYVGCMGGIGRTGLFMAGLAKVQKEYHRTTLLHWYDLGRGDPVKHVRRYYKAHAVETKPQMDFIEALYVRDIAKWVRDFEKHLLTN